MINFRDVIWDIKGFFLRRINDIKYFPKTVKYAYQRVVRGWDDSMWWELNDRHAEMMVGVLTQFKERHCGMPMKLMNGRSTEEASTEWEKILDTMIDGFKAYQEMDDIIFIDDREQADVEYKKLKRRLQKGLKMFSKYYTNLWD